MRNDFRHHTLDTTAGDWANSAAQDAKHGLKVLQERVNALEKRIEALEKKGNKPRRSPYALGRGGCE